MDAQSCIRSSYLGLTLGCLYSRGHYNSVCPYPLSLESRSTSRSLYQSHCILLLHRADQHTHHYRHPTPTAADNLQVANLQCKEDGLSDFLYRWGFVRGLNLHLRAICDATADLGVPPNSACTASVARMIVLLRIDREDLTCAETSRCYVNMGVAILIHFPRLTHVHRTLILR